ncbi:MAG: serine/threonine protein kinase [Euryarchaeota archaeon]|nr:serine/threonine protein kinase [Euryarchaeota archaeon]
MTSADAVLAFASGVPLVVLGAILLTIRPARRDQFFFGSFAVLWGVQVSSANLGRVLESAQVHSTSYLLSFAVMPAAFLFLTHFALRREKGLVALVVPVTAGIVALAGTVALLFDPPLVVAAVGERQGPPATTLGPLAFPLFIAPFYAVFFVALVAMYRRYRMSGAGSPRKRYRGLVLALALFTSYVTTRNLLVSIDPPETILVAGAPSPLPITVFFALGLLVVSGLLVHLLLRPPPPEERDIGLVAAFVVPGAVAAIESLLVPSAVAFDTAGLWRLATVGALVYTLARHQLFDLDLRLKRLAGPGIAGLAIGFGALGSLAYAASGAGIDMAGPPILVGTLIAGTTWMSRDAVGNALFPGVKDEPDYIRQRKLEVYRASLERAIAETAPLDDGEVKRVRKSLGISESEHQVMVFMVRENLGTKAPPEPQAPPRVEPGAVLLDGYKVSRLLGEGAYGRAYLAYDQKLDREVVVKAVGTMSLGGKAASMLLREARLAGSLQHPNVIAIHDVAEGAYEAIIVMEYADGGNLYSLLKRRGRLSLAEATSLLDQILSGLEAAHAKAIVHRDVKPENILLMKDGTVKLGDFGVARESRPDATGITAGGVAGTLLYMSPEQVRGLAVDGRSDLYAAAVVFHQALTGRFYLRIAGKDDFQVRQLILEGEPVLSVKDHGEPVETFLRSALSKDPEDRFKDASEMRGAIRNAAPGLLA